MRIGKLVGAVVVAGCLAGAMNAQANLIQNGSFELGAYDDSAHSGYDRLAPGSADITGWIAGGDGLDWHIIEGADAHFGRNGVDGSQYAVDLSNDGGGRALQHCPGVSNNCW